MANYKKVNITPDARTELHDALSLTGAEISINSLPAGAGVPFVHFHKNNEEIYAVFRGRARPSLTVRRWSWLPGIGFGLIRRQSANSPQPRTPPSVSSASRSKRVRWKDTQKMTL